MQARGLCGSCPCRVVDARTVLQNLPTRMRGTAVARSILPKHTARAEAPAPQGAAHATALLRCPKEPVDGLEGPGYSVGLEGQTRTGTLGTTAT